MSIIVHSHPTCVIMIPMKTGSTWIRAMLRENEIAHSIYHGKMCNAGTERRLHNKRVTHHLCQWPAQYNGHHKIVTLRHPVSWYKSYWLHYRSLTNPEITADQVEAHVYTPKECWEDFDEFVNWTQEAHPKGFMSQYMAPYIEAADMFWVLEDIAHCMKDAFGIQITVIPPRNTAKEHYAVNDITASIIEDNERQYYDLYKTIATGGPIPCLKSDSGLKEFF